MIKHFDSTYPEIANSAYVAESADIIGRVVLCDEASVWYGVVLRGDIEPIRLGFQSNIQDNSTCHTSKGNPVIIGEKVTVGHNVILHGCSIENECLIGMGSILLDGSLIRKNSIVAAGSLIPPGKEFPRGSVIMGNPARVVRSVSDEHFKMIKHGYTSYAARGQQLLKQK